MCALVSQKRWRSHGHKDLRARQRRKGSWHLLPTFSVSESSSEVDCWIEDLRGDFPRPVFESKALSKICFSSTASRSCSCSSISWSCRLDILCACCRRAKRRASKFQRL
jgi:hypothetical protein